jgi:hypothetical protein
MLDLIYRYVGNIFLVLVFTDCAVFLLIRLVVGTKFDKLFRHVHFPNDIGIGSSLARSIMYSSLIIGQNSPLIRTRKKLTKLFTGYCFRHHASSLDVFLSYLFWWVMGLIAVLGIIMLLLHLIFKLN